MPVLGSHIGAHIYPQWADNSALRQPGTPQDPWSAAAVQYGLYMVRQPSSSLTADLNNPYLLAWDQPDEAVWDNHHG
jgi:hypothetical protein